MKSLLKKIASTRSFLLMVVVTLSVSSTVALGDPYTVMVPGSPDCDGVLSNYCGWGDVGTGTPDRGEGGGSGGGGGEGGGGGGTSVGTTGKNMDFNRTDPECQNEAQAVAEAQSQLPEQATVAPLGTLVPITLNDPLYSDGNWEKWQTIHIQHSWSQATQVTLVFKQVVHYLVNRSSGAIAQVKLKNSSQYGCEGMPQ